MSSYDFTYTFPSNFTNTVVRLIKNHYSLPEVSRALESCSLDYEDIGRAYYAGIKGNNWDMNALDFTIEGPERDIETLERHRVILKKAFDHAIKSRQTGFQIHEIILMPNDDTQMLPSSNPARLDETISEANMVLNEIIRWGETMCANPLYTSELAEDSFNDFLRDTLASSRTLEVRDQTRHGLSSSGLSAGEVDILVKRTGKEIALIEGVKLSHLDRSKIDLHIRKVIDNYNPLGTSAFFVCYTSASDFESFWNKCVDHLKAFDYPFKVKSGIFEHPHANASTRVASMMLSRDGYDFPLYVIAFKLLK